MLLIGLMRELQGGGVFISSDIDCKTVFLRIQVRASSVRLARFARVRLLRHALPISLLILRKNRLFCSLAVITLSGDLSGLNCASMGEVLVAFSGHLFRKEPNI